MSLFAYSQLHKNPAYSLMHMDFCIHLKILSRSLKQFSLDVLTTKFVTDTYSHPDLFKIL